MILRLAAAAALALLAGCSSSGYDSSWTNTAASAEPLELEGKPVATFLLAPSEDMRRAVETMMSDQMSARGVEGVPGFTLLTRAQLNDRDLARQRLAQREVAGVLLMRPMGSELRARYVPGRSYYANLGYDTLWSYWGVWGQLTHEPGHYDVDQKIYVETLYYSVPDDMLLWGGVTSVDTQNDLGDTFSKVVMDTGREMRQAGLLPR